MKKPEIFANRGAFAETMLGRYKSQSPNNVVSDIGAGFGFMEEVVTKLGLSWQPFDYYKKIDRSTVWDLNKPCPEQAEKPGMVLMLEVLEHLPNPLISLEHVARHLEPGGFLFLTTPNPASSKNRINLIKKGELYAFGKQHLDEYHVFTPWKHIVESFMETVGLELLDYVRVDDNYSRQKPRNIKEFVKFNIERYIEKRDPMALGMSYGMVARKTVK